MLAALAIAVNVVLAMRGYAETLFMWEVLYTPIAGFLGVWPLYMTGVIDATGAVGLLTLAMIPMVYVVYTRYRVYTPLLIVLWAALNVIVFYDSISEFVLSTVIPGVSAMASIAITVVIILAAIYLGFLVILILANAVKNRLGRRDY